jgi:hypothetical protein
MSGTSTVVTIQNDDSVDAAGATTAQLQINTIQSMVDAVLSTLAGGADNPWPVLLPGAGPCTRIGLKVNCLSRYLPTSAAIVRAIISSLQSKLQVCPSNIVVWDRTFTELAYGKYTADDLLGARLLGTTGSSSSGVNGPGYTEPVYGTFEGCIEQTMTWVPYTPLLSRILTEETDVTINCAVLKHHGVSGVTAALKNCYGIIDNPGLCHQNVPTILPALYNISPIRNSIKLTIADALKTVAMGDTSDMFDSKPGRIFASLDPVALDRYALDLINQLRAQHNGALVSGDIVSWLDNAYQLGLGTKNYNLVDCSAAGAGTDGSIFDGSEADVSQSD